MPYATVRALAELENGQGPFVVQRVLRAAAGAECQPAIGRTTDCSEWDFAMLAQTTISRGGNPTAAM